MGDRQSDQPKHEPLAGSSMRKLARRPLIAAVVVALLLIVGRVLGDAPQSAASGSASASASAQAPPPKRRDPDEALIASAKDIERVEDPIALRAAGTHWLKAGNKELARKCFEAYVAKHEVNLYDSFDGDKWGDAIVLELMGDFAGAEKLWREGIEGDPKDTYYYLAHFSQHPKRKALLDDVKKHVLDVVAGAKRGEQRVIYITSKGAPRYLEVISQEDAEKSFAEGELVRYAYLDELHLEGRTWPKRVGCQYCVIGKLSGWDATFEEQLDFNGFILDEFHVGKHWNGEVNKSSFEKPATFNRLYIDHSVFFGKADFDSISVDGRVFNAPFATFASEANFRSVQLTATAEFRFTHFAEPVSFKSARFRGSSYFSYAHFQGLDLSRSLATNRPMHFASASFDGDLVVEDAAFKHGVTFENSRFDGNVTFRRCEFAEQLNFSRIVTTGDFTFRRNEAKDLLFYGGEVQGQARFDNNVLLGSSRFSIDELTRREHLDDVTPLHKLYKLYQGDDDAEEDLTHGNQYGVTDVDDLVSKFRDEVTFANTYFKQFVGFERVVFGEPGKRRTANFYNAQFGGEAHFERARFYGIADFRTVGGAELSFNQARFHDHWLLDDANVPGRLSTTETDLLGDATISLAGADIRSFGVDYRQLLSSSEDSWKASTHRLFYERCLHALDRGDDPKPYLDDPRLVDAHWDAEGEERLSDEAAIVARAEHLCIGRTIDEFTRLRDSFQRRSMSDESDWAYWHVKHYINHQTGAEGDLLDRAYAFLERMIFEKAFGWGVLLINLLATSAVVIIFFTVLMRLFCGDMEMEWDGEPTKYRELSIAALLVISMHSFLGGFGNAEALVTNSTATYKYLFTAEIMVGVIVITFFIGAYTRLVLG